jgi:calcineurin-like phosphoesterase family protein
VRQLAPPRREHGVTLLALLAATATGCPGRAADLMRFDASMPAPPVTAEESHEVHFTYTAPDAVTFDWRGNGSTLRYWAKDLPPRTVVAHAPRPLPPSAPGPWQEATADQLVPGLEYAYEVGHPVRPVPHQFRAPPAPGASGFVFAAVGDIGDAADLPAAAGVNRDIGLADPSFVLALGDLSYADLQTQAAVDRHFDDVMVWSQRAAYMPAWGNHEWEDPQKDDLRNYKGRFALPHAAASPGAPAAGCCGEDWYWFDFGAVRFIVYPEPYTRDTWIDWAQRAEPLFVAAEADPRIKFVITAGHRPAYSSGHHGSDLALRAILDGFGRRFKKYVLNLNGHSHVYERTTPQAHVVHVTAGTGGGALEHAATPCLWNSCAPPAFTAARAIHHGFLKITVRPGELALEAICGSAAPGEDDVRCGEGEILDQTIIPAGGATVAATPRRRPDPLFH